MDKERNIDHWAFLKAVAGGATAAVLGSCQGKWRRAWMGVYTGRYTYFRGRNGDEELYHNAEGPLQMRNLALGRREPPLLNRMRARLSELLLAAHDDFQAGRAYGRWFDEERNLARTGLGPVSK